MAINWVGVFNRLWRIIDAGGDCYFGGPRFLNAVREVNPDLPAYGQFIDETRRSGRSTSRRDYFYDVLMELEEGPRWRAVSDILATVEGCDPNLVAEIRGILGGVGQAPGATVPPEAWNAERLNGYLAEIDAAIAAGQNDRAVALSYTCLEGFYVLNLVNHASHAVDRARNRLSEAYFAGEAGRWLATYVRDLVNIQIRLLLHFM